jgi:hypothetical protein
VLDFVRVLAFARFDRDARAQLDLSASAIPAAVSGYRA